MRYLIIAAALICTACGTALPTVKPYKLDIQQGNVVTSKMLLQLRPGMTKSQVRFIMGTPLIQDSFHGNRWDYVYQMREQGKLIDQRRVILDFEKELLKTVRGDVTPATGDKPAAAAEAANTGTRSVNPSARPADKSVLDKLKFWKKDETKPAAQPTDSAKANVETTPSAETKPAEATKSVEEAVNKNMEAAPTEAAPIDMTPMSPTDNASPAEEVKSILSVPMELPKSAPLTIETAPAIESTPEIKPTPKVEVPEIESIKAKPAEKAVEQIKESTPAPEAVLPKKAVESVKAVESTAEMTNAKSEVITPIESKSAPDSPELPAEDSPSFFDKMLEKIGF